MNESSSLQQRIAVITGGSRGIGAAIAQRLATMGIQVVILGRDRQALQAVAEQIDSSGGRVLAKQCDLEQESSVRSVAAEIGSECGPADILVNCAGVGLTGRNLLECSSEDWERVMNTNLRAVFYTVRAFAPAMVARNSGSIINISSIAGRNPLPSGAIYAASKWGLNGLSYSLAEELRVHNIRVSVISPGSVHSSFSRHEGQNTAKMLVPEDVAHAVVTLITQRPESFISEIILRPTQKP